MQKRKEEEGECDYYNHTKRNAHQVNNTHHQKQQHNMIVEEMNSVTIRVKQMLFEETSLFPERTIVLSVLPSLPGFFFEAVPLLPYCKRNP